MLPERATGGFQMILSLLFGTLVGFALAIPPGPIAVAVMRGGLRHELKRAESISLGASILDTVYCVVLMFATSAVANILSEWEHDYANVYFAFQVASVIGIIAYGIVNLRIHHHTVEESEAGADHQLSFIKRLQKRSPFFIGVGLALANLANPTFIPSLTYMTVVAQQYGLVENSAIARLLYSVGFGVGTFVWLSLLATMLARYKHLLSPTFIDKLHRFAGITIIGFGAYLGLRVFALL